MSIPSSSSEVARPGHPKFSDYDIRALRTGVMAGSPCPIEVMRKVNSEMGIEEMSIAFGQFVDSFPMTVTGKVQKYKMREVSIEGPGLTQAAAIATA